MRLDLGQSGREGNEAVIIDEEGDDGLCVSNLTNITDYSKRDLYNKLKEMEISLATQSGFLKEGITVDLSTLKKDLDRRFRTQGNSESQQKNLGGEGSRSQDDGSSLSSTSSEEEDPRSAAAPSG